MKKEIATKLILRTNSDNTKTTDKQNNLYSFQRRKFALPGDTRGGPATKRSQVHHSDMSSFGLAKSFIHIA